MSKKEQGRPPGKRIAPQLLENIIKYPYSDTPFTKEAQDSNRYSEAKLRKVVKTISQVIQNFIINNPVGHEPIFDLVKPKIQEEFWEQYIAGTYPKDLLDAKTLKNCLVKKLASDKTINVFKAFTKVLTEEKINIENLQRIVGCYYVYSVHNTMPGKFQYSLLRITEKGQAILKFKNRQSNIDTQNLGVEMIGNRNLLFTLKESDYLLAIYLYIGDEENLSFLQAVSMYSNRMSQTIANLLVFEKINIENEEEFVLAFNPKRGLDAIPDNDDDLGMVRYVKDDRSLSVRQNIQRFLLHRSKPIVPKGYKGIRPFDFSRHVAVYPGPYRQEALHYSKMKWLVGKYYIYFNERFPSNLKDEGLSQTEKRENRIFEKNRFFSTVQRALIEIEKDEISGVLKCVMRSRKDSTSNELVHKGNVLNHELDDGAYILLSVYLEPEKDRCLNILLNIAEENKFIGCHQISYISAGRLGAGAIILVRASQITGEDTRISKEAWENEKPQTFLPHTFHSTSTLENQIISLLSQNESAAVRPPSNRELTRYKGVKYQGLYEMFSWSEDETIQVSLLKIYNNGYVRHFSITQREDISLIKHHAYGRLEKSEQSINILLTSESGDRTGFFCFKVDEYEPLLDDTCYAGTFAGMLKGKDKMPMASKFLLDFKGKENSMSNQIEKLTNIYENNKLEENKNLKKAAAFFKYQKNEKFNMRLTYEGNVFTWDDVEKFSK